MQYLVLIFGVAIALIGLVGIISPPQFRRWLGALDSQSRFLFAIIFRLAMGTLLLLAADELRFSLAMKILGGIAIVAAFGILVMGRDRLDRLLNWFLARPDAVMRLSTFLAAAFGVFLVYVAV